MKGIAIAKDYYNCFNAKDYSGMLALLDSQVRHEPNQGHIRIGRTLFEAFLTQMEESYDETLSDLVFFEESTGERVAVEFIVNGTYLKADEGMPPANGQTYRLPAAAFLEIKAGEITRVTTYYNLPLWLKLVS